MKKANLKTQKDEPRSEYDFAKMKGGIRGKYAARFRSGTNLVLLDPEIAKVFPTDASVNRTLRVLLDLTSQLPLKNSPRFPKRQPWTSGKAATRQ
jgi:hypothetical protein